MQAKQKREFLSDWNLVSTRELASTEKLVLMILKYHIGGNKYSTVGQTCLAEEAGLSRATVINAVRSLKQKGWITITRREYATHEYRLVEAKFQRKGSCNLTSPVNSDDTPLYSELTGGCQASLHKGNITKTVKTKNPDQEVKAFAGKPATASQTLNSNVLVEENIKVEKGFPPTKQKEPPIFPTLVNIWMTRIPELYPNHEYVAPLTSKQRGQLVDFIKKLGTHDPAEVFDRILINWGKFRSYIYENRGDKSAPVMPSIPYLLTYADDAVNCLIEVERKRAAEEERKIKIEQEIAAKKQRDIEYEFVSKRLEVAKKLLGATEFLDERIIITDRLMAEAGSKDYGRSFIFWNTYGSLKAFEEKLESKGLKAEYDKVVNA